MSGSPFVYLRFFVSICNLCSKLTFPFTINIKRLVCFFCSDKGAYNKLVIAALNALCRDFNFCHAADNFSKFSAVTPCDNISLCIDNFIASYAKVFVLAVRKSVSTALTVTVPFSAEITFTSISSEAFSYCAPITAPSHLIMSLK